MTLRRGSDTQTDVRARSRRGDRLGRGRDPVRLAAAAAPTLSAFASLAHPNTALCLMACSSCVSRGPMPKTRRFAASVCFSLIGIDL